MVSAAALGLFGLLNIVTPGSTIRWQRRSTDRSVRRGSELGASVGSGFAGLVGATGPSPGQSDRAKTGQCRHRGSGDIGTLRNGGLTVGYLTDGTLGLPPGNAGLCRGRERANERHH